ncbi:MAG: hypothetical protein GY913_31825 [Proteobacteria bacterium]|nr:hypothetical protein [Pseudomonadota bacterium]MCP4921509.1 hypothetical protein [Pseudomonadota bacterium]
MTPFSTEHAKPLGDGLLCPIGSVLDTDLASHVVAYKRSVASRYRALTPDELEQLPPGELHVSPKTDGELWMMILDGDDVFLVSPRHRVITGSIPLLDEARRNILPRCGTRTILAGELFALRKDGRPRVGDVGMALHASDVGRLGFFVFDLMKGGTGGDEDAPPEYKNCFPILQELCDGGKRVQCVKTEIVSGTAEVERLFGEWAEGGKAEGLVVRSGDHRVFKVKPAFHLDAVIVGYTERVGDDGRDLCRSVLLAMLRENGQFQLLGSVGNFGGDEIRAEFHALLCDDPADSTYRAPRSSGALYRFVKPQHVIEIKVSDIQSDDANSRPIQRFVLEYDEAKGWRPTGPTNGVSILRPVFVRRREDKTVNAVDIRASQVLERCVLNDLDEAVEAVEFPASDVLHRAVWTKATKGLLAVRKLLVWKTNKHELDPLYPAYVVHWTDYSPGRKDPLKRTVRLAPTPEIAEALAEELVTKGVKRGWNPA